jgi:hypothetical protein
MSSKLCLPCRHAFITPKPPKTKVLDIHYSPFHEGPWKAFQERSDTSHDIAAAAVACDFCAFVVAYATSYNALGEYSISSFANSDSKSPHRQQGEPMLAIWERVMYDFEDLFSRGLGLRRQLVNDLNQLDMRIFDATGE